MLLLTEWRFLEREIALLRRLAAGLADEGVRVINGVPHDRVPTGAAAGSALGVFASDIGYAARGLPFTLGLRARALAEDASRVPVGTGLDLVHAWGREQWGMGLEVARAARCPLVIEAWTAEMATAAAAWCERASRKSKAVWISAADDKLAEHARSGVIGALAGRIVACPWGVHVPERVHEPTRDGEGRVVALFAGGRDASGKVIATEVGRVIRGIAMLREERRKRGQEGDVSLVLDRPTAARTGAWHAAAKMNAEASLSVVPGDLSRWESVLDADALIVAGEAGEQSGLILECQAAGVPVIAKPDSIASNLVPEVSCLTQGGTTAEAWRDAVRGVLDDDARASAIGVSTRQFMSERRLASDWVRRVTQLYDRVASGG